ncbi:MAG: PEGA domain-containing protein [Chloroflexi bacterium]|nr:PEGA domain-containing protein [Chloroflexota bacterium]
MPQLPFEATFSIPAFAGRSRRFGRRRALLAAGSAVIVLGGGAASWAYLAPNGLGPDAARLALTSDPPGATVEVDGVGGGAAPVELLLPPGEHRVTIRAPGYADGEYRVALTPSGAAELRADLWPREPLLQPLRPLVPGASIVAADFLPDGEVALVATLPPNGERLAWLLDGDGGLRRVGPAEAQPGLTIAPDGATVAYLAPTAGGAPGTDARLAEVTVAPPGGPARTIFALPPAPPTGDADRLVDLAWDPRGDRLLAIVRGRPSAGLRSRLLLLDPDGRVTELAELPSEVVAGSYSWSPDGARLAFLARTDAGVALCIVATDGAGAPRYLADLGGDDPLPFPPLAWSPDGAYMVYAAQDKDAATGGWLFSPRGPGLFAAAADRPRPTRLGAAEGLAPAWRPDGQLVTLARPKGSGGPLGLRAIEPDGRVRELVELPLRTSGAVAARWDPVARRALVAARAGGRVDHWLLDFRGGAR